MTVWGDDPLAADRAGIKSCSGLNADMFDMYHKRLKISSNSNLFK
ncbi:hypothetical protein SXCC_03642 [Gluconacetobacter sp. SXCC-1]|nr:hypothetical protein SXCC_03642 [Gluconacetobacter sp. SXCC-1]